ncbi:isovaleryl-CoA dehydrogenase, mitochondrial [Tanacetum coccineum]
MAMEDISRASASVGLSYSVHSNACINQLVRHGNAAQKEKYLPKLISGEHVGALSISEPNGALSKTDVSCQDSKGITAFIEFYIMARLNLERLVLRIMDLSDHAACLELFIPYVRKERSFSERPLESFILYSFDKILESVTLSNIYVFLFDPESGKIADMYAGLQSSRSYLYSVARDCDKGKVDPKDCAGVMLVAAERATQVALQAIQCLGGNGYVNDYQTGRFLRDAKFFEIDAGTSEMKRMIMGRRLFKEE